MLLIITNGGFETSLIINLNPYYFQIFFKEKVNSLSLKLFMIEYYQFYLKRFLSTSSELI